MHMVLSEILYSRRIKQQLIHQITDNIVMRQSAEFQIADQEVCLSISHRYLFIGHIYFHFSSVYLVRL